MRRQPKGIDMRTDNTNDTKLLALFYRLSACPAESHEYARLREQIVAECLPMAEHVARRFGGRGQDHEDLVQVARLGLVSAVNRFDSAKGKSFIGFAIPTMMGEVRRHFRDYGWTVHVPRSVKDRRLQIAKATKELTQSLNRTPTASEIAAALDIDRQEVVDDLVAGNAYSARSLDAPITAKDGSSKLIANEYGRVDAGFDLVTDREAIRPLLAKLSQQEREVLHMRFFASMSQSQIAERVGVSQMQISRILDTTLRRLREQTLR
jgi:RNA polymerase sigma-B factor